MISSFHDPGSFKRSAFHRTDCIKKGKKNQVNPLESPIIFLDRICRPKATPWSVSVFFRRVLQMPAKFLRIGQGAPMKKKSLRARRSE